MKDQKKLEIAAFKYLNKVVSSVVTRVLIECPDCGSRGPHDMNGDARDPQALCCRCGHTINLVSDGVER